MLTMTRRCTEIVHCTHPTITYLFEEQVAVGWETRDQVLGQVKERAQYFERQMVSRGTLQHERDDKESSVLDHVLLHCLRALHQFADETQQLWAGKGRRKGRITVISQNNGKGNWALMCDKMRFNLGCSYTCSINLIPKNISGNMGGETKVLVFIFVIFQKCKRN